MELSLFAKFILISKITIVAIVLSFSCNSFAFDYKESDKQLHLGATALMSSGTYLLLRQKKYSRFKASTVAFIFSIAVAHLKEDYIDTTYNQEDMEANAVGSAIGIMIPLVFTF